MRCNASYQLPDSGGVEAAQLDNLTLHEGAKLAAGRRHRSRFRRRGEEICVVFYIHITRYECCNTDPYLGLSAYIMSSSRSSLKHKHI